MSVAFSAHVTILLASYQGARFLPQQLASIAGQTYRDWSLIVSDDGSADRTRDILHDFALTQPQGRVRLVHGPGKGATQNFLYLLEQAPSGSVIAFCDQDDVWFPDKLARAVRALHPHRKPAHYAARTVICDESLRPLAGSRHFCRPLGFRNALVQACMAGNTSLFNPAAADLLKQAAPAARAAGILSHDWWAYQITSGAGGTMIHDPRPALYYRQHRKNEAGRNDTPRALTLRLGKLLGGAYGGWLAANHTALDKMRDLLSPENRNILDGFGAGLRLQGLQIALAFARLGLYRQTLPGTTALYSAGILGRLRHGSSQSETSPDDL